jgi:hypothetical protein
MSQVAIKGAKPPKMMLAKLLAIDTPNTRLLESNISTLAAGPGPEKSAIATAKNNCAMNINAIECQAMIKL